MSGHGWVEAVDPRSGKTYYANTITKQTQWEKPAVLEQSSAQFGAYGDNEARQEELPSNWEEMHDPTTGKPFYVDHERKITQWTRPEVQRQASTNTFSYAPASPSFAPSVNTPSRAAPSNVAKSYFQEASYFQHSVTETTHDVDFSDSLPKIDFSVKKVADKFRSECPNCDALFTLSKRRHHCRLCGDVFCDSCSNHRVSLPLEGSEFDKPVRVCDLCNRDVEQGNFFSMRRYLAPLTLFDPEEDEEEGADDAISVASARNVNAALDALASDLDQYVQSAEGLENKVTIPSETLVPNIIKHLNHEETADRAVRALSSLLSFGSMAGKQDFGRIILRGEGRGVDSILNVLERSGRDRRTLYVQEKAAQVLFHLTDNNLLTYLRTHESGVDDPTGGSNYVLDIQRSLRNMLDHSSSTNNPNLQRWSIATIRNLIVEDEKRTCLAVNDVAALIASGRPPTALKYESCLNDLVSSGGVMILCSLIAATDSDTRANAISALAAVLAATRSIDSATVALSDMSGGSVGHVSRHDAQVVRAVLAGGGVSSSVAQLLLSADNNIAQMGCSFVYTLVAGLVQDAEDYSAPMQHYECENDPTIYGACRESALGVITGECLPALLSLVHEGGHQRRPLELRCIAAQSLAAVVVAVAEMGKAWSLDRVDNDNSHAPSLLLRATRVLSTEKIASIFLEVAKSPAYQTLGSQTNTAASKIRESAGIVLGTLASFLPNAPHELSSGDPLTFLLTVMNDDILAGVSKLRADRAPKYLGYVEAASACLNALWSEKLDAPSDLLDTLLIVLDSGMASFLFKMLSTRIEWESKTRAPGGMKVHTVACDLLSSLFGLANADTTGIGLKRLIDACNYNVARRRGGRAANNLFEAVLGSLQTCLSHAHKTIVEGLNTESQNGLALMELVGATVQVTGSMCGSSTLPWKKQMGVVVQGNSESDARETEMRSFDSTWKAVCKVACDICTRNTRAGNGVLSTLLVGACGEDAAKGAIRLARAIAENGDREQRSKLAMAGVLVPTADMLKSSLTVGNWLEFSSALALLRLCGPEASASSRSGGIQPVGDAIRTATKILWLSTNKDAAAIGADQLEALKRDAIVTIASLSQNSSLWSIIAKDSLLSIFQYLETSLRSGGDPRPRNKTRAAALETILQIIQVPSNGVYALEVGLQSLLNKLLNACVEESQMDFTYIRLAMKVLHEVSSLDQSNNSPMGVDEGLLQSVFQLLGKTTSCPDGSLVDVQEIVFLGMELVLRSIAKIEMLGETPFVLQSNMVVIFTRALAPAESFLRSLCATCFEVGLRHTGLEASAKAPGTLSSAHHRTLALSVRPCGDFDNMEEAALALLFHAAVYAAANDNETSTSVWRILVGAWGSYESVETCNWSLAFSIVLSHMVIEHHSAFAPRNEDKSSEHESLRHPLVLYKLLEAVRDIMGRARTENGMEEKCLAILIEFNLPKILLSASTDLALAELAFDLMELIVEADSNKLQALFLATEETTRSLVTLLSSQFSKERIAEAPMDNLAVFARLLLAVFRNDSFVTTQRSVSMREPIIRSIALACAVEWDREPDGGNLQNHANLSKELTSCLITFCSGNLQNAPEGLSLTRDDAVVIAGGLGKKICKIVLTRFLERARLEECDMGGEINVLDTPEVDLLCALAKQPEAMSQLRSVGGYHALAQIAGEGKIEAINAIIHVSLPFPAHIEAHFYLTKTGQSEESDMSFIVEADTHVRLLSLFSSEKENTLLRDTALESSTLNLLATLLSHPTLKSTTLSGSPGFDECLERALRHVVGDDEKLTENSQLTEVSKGTTGEGIKETLTVFEKDVVSARKPRKDLVLSSERFISAAIHMSDTRSSLLANVEFVDMVLASAAAANYVEKQIVAIETVTKLVPYITDETALDGARTAGVFCEVLQSPQRLMDPFRLIVCARAASGLSLLHWSLEESLKERLLECSTVAFESVLKCRSLSQCTENAADRTNAASLAFTLTCIFLNSLGNAKHVEILRRNALPLLSRLVQWHFDPDTRLAQDEKSVWHATASQGLQILASVLSFQRGETTGDIQRIQGSNWMVAAPQKSPRMAISLAQALVEASKGDQAVSALMATSILELLDAGVQQGH